LHGARVRGRGNSLIGRQFLPPRLPARISLSSGAMTTRATTGTKSSRPDRTRTAEGRRVIAVGKRIEGRWQVRTSLWRYLAATALSSQ
jgi:hypothetical protein